MQKEMKTFSNLFHEVFDEDGNIRAVRREKCAELIRAAKRVTPIYGNEETGWTNPEAIKALYAELFPNGEDNSDEF